MKNLVCTILLVAVSILFGSQNLAGTTNLQKKANASVLWKFKTNGDIHASALVDNGVLYIGSLDSTFYAVDISTGNELWHFKAKDKIYTTAVKSNNIICFESGNVLYGLNLQGVKQWQFTLYDGDVKNQNDQWDYYRSSPCLAGGNVYIGSEKGLVFGVDIASGTKTFQCQSPEAEYVIKTMPAVYDNKIYVGDWDGVFYAFNLSDGTVAWQFDTKTDKKFDSWVNAIVTDPVIYKDAVYFGGRCCALYCFDPKTGEKKWEYRDKNDMWVVGGPTIVDDIAYTGSSYQFVVRKINALNGKFISESSVNSRVNGKPLVDSNFVFVGTQGEDNSNSGNFLALDKATGQTCFCLKIGWQIYSSPILQDGIIYFGAANGYVYAVSKQDFLSTLYPDTYLTCPGVIDLGKLQNAGSYSTSVYVYNKGLARDSVTVNCTLQDIKFEPMAFGVSSGDSQLVTISIDLSNLSVKKYSGIINFVSRNSMLDKTIMKMIKFSVENTSDVESRDNLPKEFSLSRNYPNPFNPSTLIKYDLPVASNVIVKVYDITGKEVATLIDGYKPAGSYKINWDAGNFASGIYIYTLKAGEFYKSQKMLLLK